VSLVAVVVPTTAAVPSVRKSTFRLRLELAVAEQAAVRERSDGGLNAAARGVLRKFPLFWMLLLA
jgi:hypothetical protein